MRRAHGDPRHSDAGMEYRITADGEVIGTSCLERCDPSMGVVDGVFVPSPAYERVRAVFRLYADAGTSVANQDTAKLEAYYAARDALHLGVETEEGVQLPVIMVHVTDYSPEIGEYEVSIWTEHTAAFESCAGEC